jgi:hypothetical protein
VGTVIAVTSPEMARKRIACIAKCDQEGSMLRTVESEFVLEIIFEVEEIGGKFKKKFRERER